MPEIKAQPQFWPRSVTISRDSVTILDHHEDVKYNRKNGTVTIGLHKDKDTDAIKLAMENSSPFSPWIFELQFETTASIHGAPEFHFKVVTLLCKNGKPCGLVGKLGRILRAPDIAVKLLQVTT